MKVLVNYKIDSISSIIKQSFNDKCIVFYDKSVLYVNIAAYV